MSTLYVDTINEKTSGNGVYIPGHVVQIVKDTLSSNFESTSTSNVDTGMSVTVTPKGSNSQFVVHCYHNYEGNGPNIYTVIRKDGTQIFESYWQASSGKNPSTEMTTFTISSSASFTIDVYTRLSAATSGNRWHSSGTDRIATLLVMEIAQ